MGRVFKYGDNVDTDVIIPARYLNDASNENLKAHAMEDIDASFHALVKEGDIVVGGYNFGCGSSREHAPLALKASGVKIVIAKSFARIFFRNAINTGLLVIEDARMADEISQNDTLTIDSAKITDVTTGKEYPLPTLDGYVQKIIEAGGLMNLIKEEN
ncbi:MAG: 3-isopropylmalate dehydratase small subunit [Clostridia bacterium]|nr:3-isopropylmalate dehydratase small subunit [Clostridia bacterium]